MDRVLLSQLRLRSRFFKKKKSSNNNGQASSAEFAAENLAELGSGAGGDETARTLRRPRFVWTQQLHMRFVDAVAHLGIDNATPKTIMQLMSVDGLTKGNVSSHLQNYRLYIKRMQGLSGAGGNADDDDGDNNGGGNDGNDSNDGNDGDNNGGGNDGNESNDGNDGDDRDNNGGGGDKNKKKGGGHSEGNGNGRHKAEGGDGKEKGMNMNCTVQLGFGYRCTYHAGYENGYPVGQLYASKCSDNDCSIMPPVMLV